MNWIKRNWLPLLAVVLSVMALVRCEPFTFKETNLEWIIGISIAVISLGIVIVLGYQIYNAATLDKRMRDMFDKKTEEVRESLGISNARAIAAVLYQAESASLKLNIALKDHKSTINTLRAKLEYAISLNEEERLNEIARLIVDTRGIIIRNSEKYEYSLDNYFLELAQSVLTRLSASDVQVPRLYELINQILSRKSNEPQPKQ